MDEYIRTHEWVQLWGGIAMIALCVFALCVAVWIVRRS